ncbi:MAG: invasion associated locus B family protein [Rhodospirillales bacterium]|nr:invasion associated locus B family protein [Rhodospirillales bacterium]
MMKKVFLTFTALGLLSAGLWGASSVFSLSPQPALAAETEAGAAGDAKPVEPWGKRCSEETKHCEIVQRLTVQETGKRFAEFAIGYPDDADGARGVVILPLGVLLEPGVRMQIDDGQVYQFTFRYCGAGGCVAVIRLSDALIAEMKKGNAATIQFMSAKGQKINVPITLKGFTKAIREVAK